MPTCSLLNADVIQATNHRRLVPRDLRFSEGTNNRPVKFNPNPQQLVRCLFYNHQMYFVQCISDYDSATRGHPKPGSSMPCQMEVSPNAPVDNGTTITFNTSLAVIKAKRKPHFQNRSTFFKDSTRETSGQSYNPTTIGNFFIPRFRPRIDSILLPHRSKDLRSQTEARLLSLAPPNYKARMGPCWGFHSSCESEVSPRRRGIQILTFFYQHFQDIN